MSAEPAGFPAEQTVCALCATPLASGAERCRACGLVVGTGPTNPNPFTQRALWAMIGGLVVIYVVVLAMVALLR